MLYCVEPEEEGEQLNTGTDGQDGGCQGVVREGGAQVTGEVSHTHGGGGGEQVAHTYQRRKYRLTNGIICDGQLELAILTFTQQTEHSGVGAVRRGIIWAEMEKLQSETKNQGPGRCV